MENCKNNLKENIQYYINHFKIFGIEDVKFDFANNSIIINKFNREINFFYEEQMSMTKIVSIIDIIGEIFGYEEYSWLNVENREVIDIGGFIGDSAMYFAIKGARNVYAYEPYPDSFEIAKKNILYNNLENKITLFNKGVGKEKEHILLDQNVEGYSGSELKNSPKGKDIEIITLDEIADKYNLNDAILKMDCEGCEYDIILNSKKDTLRRFSQIMIEYHHSFENLKPILESSGFVVNYTLPKTIINQIINQEYKIGLIFATKITDLSSADDFIKIFNSHCNYFINKYINVDEKINSLTQKIDDLQEAHRIKDEEINILRSKNRLFSLFRLKNK